MKHLPHYVFAWETELDEETGRQRFKYARLLHPSEYQTDSGQEYPEWLGAEVRYYCPPEGSCGFPSDTCCESTVNRFGVSHDVLKVLFEYEADIPIEVMQELQLDFRRFEIEHWGLSVAFTRPAMREMMKGVNYAPRSYWPKGSTEAA